MGVFARLAKELDEFQEEGHYDATLSDFMRDSAWDQVWDVDSLYSHVHADDKVIVDFGVGDGRLIKRLQDKGVTAEFIGIESSVAAMNMFEYKKQQYNFSGKFINKNFITDDLHLKNVDFVYFGSVSINCLISIESVAKLFMAAENIISTKGRFALSVYPKKSIDVFLELDGVLSPESYVTEKGDKRIIWRGLLYNVPYLTHNAFVDRKSENLLPVLCTNFERIWHEDDIVDIARMLNWSSVKRTLSYVGDGGAEGYEVSTHSFVKD